RAAEPARVVPLRLAAQGRAIACSRPPLEGEGRTAGGSPRWGDPVPDSPPHAGGRRDAAEALSPPPGPQARADLPLPGRGDLHRTTEVPAWLMAPAPVEIGRPVAMSPSTAYDKSATPQAAPPRSREAAQAQAQAMARGTLIHRLLQSLPDVEPARREA